MCRWSEKALLSKHSTVTLPKLYLITDIGHRQPNMTPVYTTQVFPSFAARRWSRSIHCEAHQNPRQVLTTVPGQPRRGGEDGSMLLRDLELS